jgi:hypothetical protein
VLIAMGILTVGLLGVASIFPVASFYMQKGDVADRGSAIAQAAFNNLLSRGMLDPETWLMFEPTSPTSLNRGWAYSKRFAANLRNQLALNLTSTATPLAKQQILNYRYGTAYVIDPLGANASPMNPTAPLSRQQSPVAQRMPIQAVVNYTGYSWWPWNPQGASPSELQWPVMRVSLEQPAGTFSPWPLTQPVAERLFVSDDDLSLDVPTQSDRPSTQRWDAVDLNSDGKADPLARQSRGDYSWIASVVPASAAARNALATDPSAYEYEVSVAVFYKRVLDDAADANKGERLTIAKVVSTGLNGGELLIGKQPTDVAIEPFAGLKVGNWVPVCGPSPASTNENPRFVLRWYRVLSIEKDAAGLVTNPATQRLVSLRGPQWPWQPAANLTNNDLSNNLCLAIVPNVVAVHSKTVKLESDSAWSVQ